MLTAKEMATNLLNRSLRLPNNLTHFVRFEEAKEMALLQVMSIKEALYNVSIIDNHICNNHICNKHKHKHKHNHKHDKHR